MSTNNIIDATSCKVDISDIHCHIHDCGDKKLGYFHTPKCGSRTVLGWLILKQYPYAIVSNSEWFHESRQYREYREMQGMNEAVNYIDFLIRFCIVRDPVDRFMSAFTNRVLFHKRIPNINPNITFDEFFDTLEERINTPQYDNFKKHVEPLTYFLGKDPTFYNYIFNIREISKVKDLIEKIYGVTLPNLHLQKSGNIEKPKPSAHQIEWIKNRYKMDYEVYGNWF